MMCRHCRRPRVNRPRGLCWSCYYRPGVRELFPITSKFARRGVLDFNGRTFLAPVPTGALPGTPEKVAVLAERAGLGLSLWHPRDAGRRLRSRMTRHHSPGATDRGAPNGIWPSILLRPLRTKTLTLYDRISTGLCRQFPATFRHFSPSRLSLTAAGLNL